jgi:hypothetical protein
MPISIVAATECLRGQKSPSGDLDLHREDIRTLRVTTSGWRGNENAENRVSGTNGSNISAE